MSKPNIEQLLSEMTTEPTPDPGFVAELERELMSAEPAKPSFWQWFKTTLFAPRRIGTTVALALMLAVLLPVAVLGPSTVVGQIQSWVGYVPEVGFVDLETTRTLPRGVTVEQDGVTLTVEDVLASAENTVLLFRFENVATSADTGDAGNPLLRMPDGTTLEPTEAHVSFGKGRFVYPPLPADVDAFTWEVKQLPLTPVGGSPQNWVVPLALIDTSSADIGDRYNAPYRLEGVSDTHQGVTVRVVEVAHSADSTALRVEIDWDDPTLDLQYFGAFPQSPQLSDELGHVYGEARGGSSHAFAVVEPKIQGEPTTEPTFSVQTEAFAPVSQQARRLTYSLGGLRFTIPADGDFRVDLGDDPQIGDIIPLDIDTNVAGFPVHISQAELIETLLPDQSSSYGSRVELRFTVDPVPVVDGRFLMGFVTSAEAYGFSGRGGGGGLTDSGDYAPHPSVTFNGDQPKPTGEIVVSVEEASIALMSDWVMTWDVPFAPVAGEPVSRPADVTTTQDGVTLRASNLAFSDAVSQVVLSAETANGAPAYIANGDRVGEYQPLEMEDDLGNTYTRQDFQPVSWRSDPIRPITERLAEIKAGAYRTQRWLTLPPLDPAAEKLTVRVPGIEIEQPLEATLDITLPEELRFAPDDSGAQVARWSADVSAELGGYDVQLDTIDMHVSNNRDVWLILHGGARNERIGSSWFNGFGVRETTLPSGEVVGNNFPNYRGGYPNVTDTDVVRVLWLGAYLPRPNDTLTMAIDEIYLYAEGEWQIEIPVR